MSVSARHIADLQSRWAGARMRDPKHDGYLASLGDNLFQGRLHSQSETEFRCGDGSELKDVRTRPAKMRALASSSALAVNFFDAWRDVNKATLSQALGLPAPIAAIQFEFKTRDYPVRPRSPNLDLLLQLEDGQYIGVESKFCEPYRSDDGHGVLSTRYFDPEPLLWRASRLNGAQELASRLRPEWIRLDAPQLLKHLLGLAHDPTRPTSLLYLWFDTDLPDAALHRDEAGTFADAVADGAIAFRATTYQTVFQRLAVPSSPVDGWYGYMQERYFPATAAV